VPARRNHPTRYKLVDLTFDRSIRRKFWSRVSKSSWCWFWTGPKIPTGYGRVWMRLRGVRIREYAHRVAYMIACGPIADGAYVCHKCDNPSCVRPSHLFVGSARDNAHDALRKGRMRPGGKRVLAGCCARGHALTDASRVPRGDGYRMMCRLCRIDRQYKAYWADPEKAREKARRNQAAYRERLRIKGSSKCSR